MTAPFYHDPSLHCLRRNTRTLEAELKAVRRSEVEIELPFRDDLTQQHGYLHVAAVTAIVDSAAGTRR